MLRLIICLFLFVKTSFAADYLSEIRHQYQALFGESADPTRKLTITDYPETLHKKLPRYDKKAALDLYPPGMFVPNALDRYTNYLFSIHHIGWIGLNRDMGRKEESKVEARLRNAHLDIIRTYWQGYIAFLEELNGQEGQWDEFAKDFSSAFIIPTFCLYSYGEVRVEYSTSDDKRLKESNKQKLLPVFFIHYALGTFFHPSKSISPQMKLKALQIWKRVDPEMQFFSSGEFNYRYGYTGYQDKKKNLLPETFDQGIIEDQEIDGHIFYENASIIKIFGNHDQRGGHKWTQESFQKGLMSMLVDHKQDLIQVLHSLLQLNQENVFGHMVLRFLFKITESQDADFLGLILGEHASFRNKGRITLVLDDLPLLSKDLLIKTVRSQKRRLDEMKMSMAQAEENHKVKTIQLKDALIGDKARHLLGSLNKDVDDQGWFKLFKINPFLTFDDNQGAIKAAYHKLSLKWHPDKHPGCPAEKIADLTAKTRRLNEAYQKLTNQIIFKEYLMACWNRAQELALKEVLQSFGGL